MLEINQMNLGLTGVMSQAQMSKCAIDIGKAGMSTNLNDASQVLFEKNIKDISKALNIASNVNCNSSVAKGMVEAIKSSDERKKEACMESAVVVDKMKGLATSLGALEGKEDASL